jgi:hypothetical protein
MEFFSKISKKNGKEISPKTLFLGRCRENDNHPQKDLAKFDCKPAMK